MNPEKAARAALMMTIINATMAFRLVIADSKAILGSDLCLPPQRCGGPAVSHTDPTSGAISKDDLRRNFTEKILGASFGKHEVPQVFLDGRTWVR